MCCVNVKPFTQTRLFGLLFLGPPDDVGRLSPSATLTATNVTGIDLGSNPSLCGERPTTNQVSHGAAFEEENEPEVCLNIYSTAR
jgi:hypothetical protein